MKKFMKALEWLEKHEGHSMKLKTSDGEGEIIITGLFNSCDYEYEQLLFIARDSQGFYACLKCDDDDEDTDENKDESAWCLEIRTPHYLVQRTSVAEYEVKDMRVNADGNFEIICDEMNFIFIELPEFETWEKASAGQ